MNLTLVDLFNKKRVTALALLTDVQAVDIAQDFDGEWIATFFIDESLWERFTPEVFDELVDSMPMVTELELAVEPPESRWRTEAANALGIGPTNQATRAPWTLSKGVIHDGMRFRDPSERATYDALKEKQEELAASATLGIVVNPSIRVVGRTWEPDFIVTRKGRALAVEVDGGSHRGRYADDRSRDELLKDAGLQDVYRIPVEHTESAEDLRQHVDRIVSRLA